MGIEYQKEFGDFPSTGALLGRSAAEMLVKALEAAEGFKPQSLQL